MNPEAAGGVFMANNGIPYKNPEGYSDPTTYGALNSVMRQHYEKLEAADARCNILIKTLKNTIDLAGFDLVARIEVKDRETGRVYK